VPAALAVHDPSRASPGSSAAWAPPTVACRLPSSADAAAVAIEMPARLAEMPAQDLPRNLPAIDQ